MATTTAAKIIRRALLILNVIDAEEAAEAIESQDALDILNAMLAEWYEAGVGLHDYVLTGITDTLATDAADSEAIAYQLAARLAPEYNAQLSPAALEIAQATFSRLRMRYFQPGTVDFTDLPWKRYSFNIVTGY